MASNKEIEKVINLIKKTKENDYMNMHDHFNKGSFAIVKYLSDNNNISTAGELSNFLCVSTARIAVILKKLEEKKIIEKTRSENDARVTIVKLTDYGKNKIKIKKIELYEKIGKVIDEIGMEEIIKFNETITKINHIMKSEDKISKGEINDKNI